MNASNGKMIGDKDGAIGWIIFNDPKRHNAISHEMRLDLLGILGDFENDDAIRVVVLRGAGDKSFVSGADISQFEGYANNPERQKDMAATTARLLDRYDTYRKPLIAMIQGYCLGAGVGTALAADLRIASDKAQFGIPAGRLGVAYPLHSVRRLIEIVGSSNATEMLFTANRYAAAEALAMGLVNKVVSTSELEATVRTLAMTIADNAPLTVRASKIAIREAMKPAAECDFTTVAAAVAACFASQDHAEGRKAFAEKRKPVFNGR
ncbi:MULTISPECIES: enoyl-CoA hydratase [unclassified Beijerinckia]|uniref:enoyl-CoA hydratase n=1 Tax=unclassified Beijerinckia TaxID=2638183 RepID=UPI00089D76D4|nr:MULTISPECIES: enoyl-CoA hydratase [unclassified Beijerinckia]MDH7797916.1 enoyl-CoA hydratase [Beijerinckia sp. GAS462]SED02768.1 Enoyl-CoA hydratase/carnithine racemase [Beijerinckia sp. 28-YEA-48]